MPDLEFVVVNFIFIPNSPDDAAQACAISEVCVPLFLYGLRRPAGAYGYDGEDLCAEKEGHYRRRIAGV